MQDYEGTLIYSEIARYLLNKVPDKIIEMKPDGVLVFDGNFEYYKERSQFLENQAAERAAELNKESNSPNRSSEENKDGGYRSKEQRRLDAQRKNRIKELEALIAEKENENTELETDMAKEEVYTDYVLMSEKSANWTKIQNFSKRIMTNGRSFQSSRLSLLRCRLKSHFRRFNNKRNILLYVFPVIYSCLNFIL